MKKYSLVVALFAITFVFAQSAIGGVKITNAEGVLVADLTEDLQKVIPQILQANPKQGSTNANNPAPAQPQPRNNAEYAKSGDRVAPGVRMYGGQGRLPGESTTDCNKRLGGGSGKKAKGVREQCGYTGVDGTY